MRGAFASVLTRSWPNVEILRPEPDRVLLTESLDLKTTLQCQQP